MNKSITFILPGWITKRNGGAEWQTYLLSEYFVEKGWYVSVITTYSKENLKESKYYNEKIKYYYYKLTSLKSLRLFHLLYKIFQADSKYFYLRTDDRINRTAAIIFSKLFNRKTIYALAGDNEIKYNKFKKRKQNSTLKQILQNLDISIINVLTNKSEHFCDLIITQTNYQSNELFKNKGLKSMVIRNSYDFEKIDQKPLKKENIVLWIGNFRNIKQPQYFLDVSKNIENFEFIMIGDYSNYDIEIFEKSNIKLLGLLESSKVSEHLSKAKYLVNTSVTEGFSNTFFEAWANGVYVLSLNSNPDNILDNKIGYCSNGSISQLSEKIHQMESEGFDPLAIRNSFLDYKEYFDLNTNLYLTEKLILNNA